MTTKEIALRLVELCNRGEFETAQNELFSNDIISIEPYDTPEFPAEVKGLNNVIAKGHKFEAMTEEMHSISVSDPLVAANSFAITMQMDITMKDKGRMNMAELCVYEVKDGKIISERFIM